MTNATNNMQAQADRDDGMVNGIHMDTLKGTVNAIEQDPDLGACKFRASNKWLGGNHNCTTVTGFYGARQEIAHQQQFELHADEPPILAGNDNGANPVEHLLNALAACVTTSMVAHAAVRGINIEELESELEGDIACVASWAWMTTCRKALPTSASSSGSKPMWTTWTG